ncbi:MAG: YigZ family protein [Flavobacteriales bacterium]|nr:YigZ family protein [Flavobacteriales bacterium]
MVEDLYQTVNSKSFGDFRDRGSKFPSALFPCQSLEELDERIKILRKEHPSARHFCFAAILNEGKLMKSNDDGEPSGTAGLPILNQLQSVGLIDIGLVVVRYFGGTKLGKPGLINAYKESAREAIENAKIIQKVRSSVVSIRFNYDDTGEVMKTVERIAHHKIQNQTFEESCTVTVSVPRSTLPDVLHLFDHSNSINISPISEPNPDL